MSKYVTHYFDKVFTKEELPTSNKEFDNFVRATKTNQR